MYRGGNKGLYVLLSRTQAGPGRTVKQEQEEMSRNYIRTNLYLPLSTQYRFRQKITHFCRSVMMKESRNRRPFRLFLLHFSRWGVTSHRASSEVTECSNTMRESWLASSPLNYLMQLISNVRAQRLVSSSKTRLSLYDIGQS